MIIELLGFAAPPDEGTNLYQTLFSSLGPTRVMPGCLGCRLYHDPDKNTHFLESRWASEEDLIRHIRSDVYKKLLLLMELGADAPSIEFFTVSEVRGLDLIEAARELRSIPIPD